MALFMATASNAQAPQTEGMPFQKNLKRTLLSSTDAHKRNDMKVVTKQGIAKSPARTSADDIIYTAPEGTVYKNMYHAGAGFIAPYGEVWELPTDGMADDVVFTDDGSVYISNPLTTFYTQTWIKGTRAVGDTIEVQLPQHFYHEDADPDNYIEESDMYLYKCAYQTVDEDGGSFFPTDDQVMKFVWRNDSLIMVNATEDSWLLGACTADGGWYGFGDYVCTYAVLHAQPVAPSAAATIQQAAFSYVGDGIEDGAITKMAIDGNDIYLAGTAPNQPEAWIKGTINGDKATFEGAQYLGVDTVTATHTFFEPVAYDETYDEENDYYDWEYYFVPSLDMDYDAATQTLTCDTLFSINQGFQLVNQQVTYEDFSFSPWTERAATPADPEIESYDDYFEDYGYSMFNFYLESTDATGYLLDKEKLHYNIYLDNDKLTFEPDEYLLIGEEMTDVPFDYTDRYDLTNYTGRYTVVIWRSGFEKIGVQLTYTGGGETHKSNIVYYVLATGETEVVDGIATPSVKTPVSVTYTDLGGRLTQKPTSGVYVKTFHYADGTKRSVKIQLR